MTFTFSIPTDIIFGEGSTTAVNSLIEEIKAKKVLCVYDKGIEKVGIADEIIHHIQSANVDVISFNGVEPNPSVKNVEMGAELASISNVDAIIAIGGGSSIDCAKAINIILTNPGSILDYEGRDVVKNKTKPLIAIPTTAGTGSEVTEVTVISDKNDQRKVVIGGMNCSCDFAILDPKITVNLPASITAATGMDALTHAIEAFVSKKASIMSDTHALKAVELISSSLKRAVQNGSDITARENMLLGSLFAGIAFNAAGLGLVHAIAHPLGSLFDVPHGVANAMGLTTVLEYNNELHSIQAKHVEIARAWGINTQNKSAEQVSYELITEIEKLVKEIKIPTLKDYHVRKTDFPVIAEHVLKENSMKFTPRDAGYHEVVNLLEKIYNN